MKNGCSTGKDLFKHCFDRTEFEDGFFGNSIESKEMLNKHNRKARFLKKIDNLCEFFSRNSEKLNRMIQSGRDAQNERTFQYTVSDYYEDD